MEKLTLYIGNKNYSSWSFRPWMAMEAAAIPFEEILIPFEFEAGNPKFKDISPTRLVPVLHQGDFRVWESLAIIEYVADLFPDRNIWPADMKDRAVARAVSMEMLGGFRALRQTCPMNMRRTPGRIDVSDDVKKDIQRIETIWRELRARSGGPYLFGAFSAADAMFAPVVSRFDVYNLVSNTDTLEYMQAIKAHPAWQKWYKAAIAEPWTVSGDEP
ncbi:glutathione S-transferase family protein [Agrobacterium sp.]|uniref:glutathione S-transferase family protein n=1 Tax=Agrobacterium sp. TaxID=361 RepID=UPI0028A6A5E0|nr:glutathione S-transferase family protein [Agrobacterium sp.]